MGDKDVGDDFEIEYEPTKLNKVADALSRQGSVVEL